PDHRDEEGGEDRDRQRQGLEAELDKQAPADEHTDYGQVALREVDEADDPVDDRVAKGDQGVERSDRQSVDSQLNERAQLPSITALSRGPGGDAQSPWPPA